MKGGRLKFTMSLSDAILSLHIVLYIVVVH